MVLEIGAEKKGGRAREGAQETGAVVSGDRWRFAQQCEEEYQREKRRGLRGSESLVVKSVERRSASVAARLAELGFPAHQRTVVEVGSGAHGLIWRWPFGQRIAVDPLARFYRREFSFLQQNGPEILSALGEWLPLRDQSAYIVLSDNVLDHTQNPQTFLRECRRIVQPSGVLFLTVDVHHPVWGWVGRVYNAFCRLGFYLRVPAFPNHPFHFQQEQVDAMVTSAGFVVVSRRGGREDRAPLRPCWSPGRPYDLLMWLFFKNVRYEIVGVPAGNAR